jgi:hypothetical protein
MNGEKQDALVLARPSAMVGLPDIKNLRETVTELMNSQFFKAIMTAPQGIAIVLYGQALGIEPVIALQTIQPVNGRMCVTTTVLQALFQKQGGRVRVLERTEDRAKVELQKGNWEPYIHEYTRQDAMAEGLWDKDNWKKRSKAMLLYRAISGGLRVYDPGSFLGIYTSEEMEDYPQGFPSESEAKPAAAAPDPEKAAKRGPGRPKAEKPASEAQLAPEKPAAAQPEAPPAEKQAPQSFGEEIGADFQGEKTQEDIEIDDLKARLKDMGVDEKAFKEWLLDHQTKMKPPRKFVSKWKNALRFHGAPEEDLKYLKMALVSAVAMWRYNTTQKPE